MGIDSTKVLQLLAADQGRYILLECAAPYGPLKRDLISVKEADGRDLVVESDGKRLMVPDLPRVMLDDFLRARLVAEIDSGSRDGVIFKLTRDGAERGLR